VGTLDACCTDTTVSAAFLLTPSFSMPWSDVIVAHGPADAPHEAWVWAAVPEGTTAFFARRVAVAPADVAAGHPAWSYALTRRDARSDAVTMISAEQLGWPSSVSPPFAQVQGVDFAVSTFYVPLTWSDATDGAPRLGLAVDDWINEQQGRRLTLASLGGVQGQVVAVAKGGPGTRVLVATPDLSDAGGQPGTLTLVQLDGVLQPFHEQALATFRTCEGAAPMRPVNGWRGYDGQSQTFFGDVRGCLFELTPADASCAGALPRTLMKLDARLDVTWNHVLGEQPGTRLHAAREKFVVGATAIVLLVSTDDPFQMAEWVLQPDDGTLRETRLLDVPGLEDPGGWQTADNGFAIPVTDAAGAGFDLLTLRWDGQVEWTRALRPVGGGAALRRVGDLVLMDGVQPGGHCTGDATSAVTRAWWLQWKFCD